jgi:hypothetical protein
MITNELFTKTYNEYDHVMNIALFRYSRFLTREERNEIKQDAIFYSLISTKKYPLWLLIRNKVIWLSRDYIRSKRKSIERCISTTELDKLQATQSLEKLICDLDFDSIYPNIMKKRFIELRTLKELSQEYNQSHEHLRLYIYKRLNHVYRNFCK